MARATQHRVTARTPSSLGVGHSSGQLRVGDSAVGVSAHKDVGAVSFTFAPADG